MADPKCVSAKAKVDIKNIDDKKVPDAVADQIVDTITQLVNKEKGLTYDNRCADGWALTVTGTIKLDDSDDTTLIINLSIAGVDLAGQSSGFNASAKRTAGINPKKKLVDEVASNVDGAVTSVMTKNILPAMK
jgi:hypothetical protein